MAVKVDAFQCDFIVVGTLRGDSLETIAAGLGKTAGWVRNARIDPLYKKRRGVLADLLGAVLPVIYDAGGDK